MEDNKGDYTIVEDFLQEQILAPVITQAKTFRDGAEILKMAKDPFDVILLDLRLPDKNGHELITEMLWLDNPCPVIILTGYSDIRFSIKAISYGILDYLIKDELTATTLYKSIIYSIERKKNISEIKASQKLYSDLFQLNPQPMFLYEAETFRFIQVNKAAVVHYGFSREEFMNMTPFDFILPEDKLHILKNIAQQKRVLNETYVLKARNYKKNGEIIEVETFGTPMIINGKATTMTIVIDVTQRNQHEHKITKAIIKAQEDERYVIGSELHDNVCQIIVATQISLGMMEKTLPLPAMEWFNQCTGYLSLALDEVRNLSHQLAPVFFEETSLEVAFRRLLDSFNVEGKYEISLLVDDSARRCPMSQEIQLNLYRVLQEQLTNIAKHAKASSIMLDMLVNNNKIQLKITDNGVGFNIADTRGGIGMANMKRRVELFCGKLEIISSPGNGCVLFIDMPLAQTIEIVNNHN